MISVSLHNPGLWMNRYDSVLYGICLPFTTSLNALTVLFKCQKRLRTPHCETGLIMWYSLNVLIRSWNDLCMLSFKVRDWYLVSLDLHKVINMTLEAHFCLSKTCITEKMSILVFARSLYSVYIITWILIIFQQLGRSSADSRTKETPQVQVS